MSTSPSGRWGGALTSRPLPVTDPEILAMTPLAREEMGRIWLSQAATEARVAKSFALIHGALVALGADAGLSAVAERAIDDEHRHTALCRTMAERYVGAAVVATPELPFAPPRHDAAESDRARRILWIVGQCAFNETFASAYLALCNDRAELPLAQAAMRELLSDEIDHARIGWAFLSTLNAADKALVQGWLEPIAIANLREWRAVRLAEDERLSRHGVPPSAAVEDALREAVADLIVPGLAHVGLDPRPLERWVARGAPT
jgi:hypothetical protein